MSDQQPSPPEAKDPMLDHLLDRQRDLAEEARQIQAKFDVDTAAVNAALREVRDFIGRLDSVKRRVPRKNQAQQAATAATRPADETAPPMLEMGEAG